MARNQPLGRPWISRNFTNTVLFGLTDTVGGSSVSRYDFELSADREEIDAVLDGVVAGIRTGTMQLGTGDGAVSVSAPNDLSPEIEFEDEEDELSLELELEWPAPDDNSTDNTIENQPNGPPDERTPVRTADESESLPRFEVFRDQGEEWRWRLHHRNGNIIASSGEGYARKHNAQKGLRSVLKNSLAAEITETTTD